jgi:hypothetical protein
VLVFAAMLVCGTSLLAQGTGPSGGTFVDTCCLGTARFSHSATLLSNGTTLIVGGFSPGMAGSALTSAELYDSSAGVFRPTGSLGKGRAEHTATLLTNGKVLVAGGITGIHVSGTAELYDPSAGTFAAASPMQQSRTQHTATLLPNGKVLIAGGLWWGGTHPHESSAAELFDSTAGVFTSTGSMTTERTQHTATLLPGGKVLIVGGSMNAPDPLASAELYDPTTGTFAAAGSMATGRKAHTATLLPNGNVLIAGGLGAGNALLDSAEIYDSVSGVFLPAGGMGVGRAFHAATALQDGRVLITGGTGAAQPQPNAALYDPASGSFAATGQMHVSRQRHTATLLPNGKVLVAGGQTLDGTFSCPELYTPPSPACISPPHVHFGRIHGSGPGSSAPPLKTNTAAEASIFVTDDEPLPEQPFQCVAAGASGACAFQSLECASGAGIVLHFTTRPNPGRCQLHFVARDASGMLGVGFGDVAVVP